MLKLVLAVVLLQQPETLSLLDSPLYAPSLPKDVRFKLESEFASAQAAYARDPSNVDATIGLARTERALGHVGDSLELLTRAIENHPDEPHLLLYR